MAVADEPVRRLQGFNILEQGATLMGAVKESLARAEMATTQSIVGDPEGKRIVIPIEDFVLQYAFKSRGFISGTVFNVIGPDGVGKSSLGYTFMGWGMRRNSPCMHVEVEAKPMDAARVKPCLNTSPIIAEKMFAAIYMAKAREIREAVDKIEKWLLAIRNRDSNHYVPISIPAIVDLDGYGKLMSPDEALGFEPFNAYKGVAKLSADDQKKADEKEKSKKGNPAAKKKAKKNKEAVAKELGGGSNMGHSKMAHAWTRQLATVLSVYNAFLIISNHQNDKVDMSGAGGGSFMSPEVKEAINRTSIGGRAFSQSAAYQVVLSKLMYEKATIHNAIEKVGLNVKLGISKNSYGPPREVQYRVCLIPRYNTDVYQEPVINFDHYLPGLLKQTGLVTVAFKNMNSWTCKELGLSDATVKEFADAFYGKPELVESLGRQLGFVGYDDKSVINRLNDVFLPAPTEREVKEIALTADPSRVEKKHDERISTETDPEDADGEADSA